MIYYMVFLYGFRYQSPFTSSSRLSGGELDQFSVYEESSEIAFVACCA